MWRSALELELAYRIQHRAVQRRLDPTTGNLRRLPQPSERWPCVSSYFLKRPRRAKPASYPKRGFA